MEACFFLDLAETASFAGAVSRGCGASVGATVAEGSDCSEGAGVAVSHGGVPCGAAGRAGAAGAATGRGGTGVRDAAGAGRGDEKLHHGFIPVMRKMGLLAVSRCSRPAGLVRLTATCVTSAVQPRAVSAATAEPRVSSAMAEMHTRAEGFLPETASSTPSMPPFVPPMNTASGAGRSASASGALPSVRVRLYARNFSRFLRMSAQASGSHSTAYTCPSGAASANSTLTLPRQTGPGGPAPR